MPLFPSREISKSATVLHSAGNPLRLGQTPGYAGPTQRLTWALWATSTRRSVPQTAFPHLPLGPMNHKLLPAHGKIVMLWTLRALHLNLPRVTVRPLLPASYHYSPPLVTPALIAHCSRPLAWCARVFLLPKLCFLRQAILLIAFPTDQSPSPFQPTTLPFAAVSGAWALITWLPSVQIPFGAEFVETLGTEASVAHDAHVLQRCHH